MPNEPFITPERHLTLNEITGFCHEFKRLHGNWPRVTASRDDFAAAGMPGLSGADIERALRTAGNGLAADPEYTRMRMLAYANGGWDVNISFIDPEYCKQMAEDKLERLVNSVCIDGDAPSRAAPGGPHIWLQLPLEPGWRTGRTARVPVTDELIDYIGAKSLIYRNDPATIGSEYYLSLVPNGRLYVKYSRILGSRYVGTLTPQRLEQFRNQLLLGSCAEHAHATHSPAQNVEQAVAKLTVEQELALLTVTGPRLQLPKQQLAHYDEISQRIAKAGGRYVVGKKHFAFDDGIDCSDVLRRLLAGESIDFQQQYQFFETPQAQAEELVGAIRETLGTLVGKRVLEPSAGAGALAGVARSHGADVIAVEAWNVNAIKLRGQRFNVVERDFLTVTPAEIGTFDAVLANPPFTRNQDIEHVMHMLQFIRPGGALSVIMSTAWLDGRTKAHAEFKEFLAGQDVQITVIKAGAFKKSGTGVSTVRLDFSNVNAPRDAADFVHERDDQAAEVGEEVAPVMN